MKVKGSLVEFAGLQMMLLPSGAVYCATHRTLWVADVHLGKAASYRRLGQPVPQGTTSATLRDLTADLQSHDVDHLIVLGDFLHGALVHQSETTLAALANWRTQHQACKITLIRGNHDDRAGDPPARLAIDVVDEPFEFASICCCHDPETKSRRSDASTMSGHVHPIAVIYGKARERLRLPCFVVGARRMILPAYGAFTGGHVYRPEPSETLFLIAGQSVIKLAAGS